MCAILHIAIVGNAGPGHFLAPPTPPPPGDLPGQPAEPGVGQPGEAADPDVVPVPAHVQADDLVQVDLAGEGGGVGVVGAQRGEVACSNRGAILGYIQCSSTVKKKPRVVKLTGNFCGKQD